jgi:hypothetical protein
MLEYLNEGQTRANHTLWAVLQLEQSRLSHTTHLATASSLALQLVQIRPLRPSTPVIL